MVGEAGLAARDARPRPRQTEARRRHRAGGHPGSGHGSRCHGPHPERDRAGPRQDAPARTATMALMQSASGAHDPRWGGALPHHGVPSGPAHDAVRRPGDRNPRIIVLRRKGRPFADTGGACRAVIGCALAGGRVGDCDRRVRTGCRGSDGVSGAAATDHPSGALGPNPQANDLRGEGTSRSPGSQVTAGLPTSRARSPRGRSASRLAQKFRQLGKDVMRCWSIDEGGERDQAACRSRPASPCSLHVRRDRSGSRRNPHYIRAAGRVVGRDRVAPAVSQHHGQRAGAGVRARHSVLAAFAARPAQAVAPEASRRALNKRSGHPGGGKRAI